MQNYNYNYNYQPLPFKQPAPRKKAIDQQTMMWIRSDLFRVWIRKLHSTAFRILIRMSVRTMVAAGFLEL
jgi:hypothetical protein